MGKNVKDGRGYNPEYVFVCLLVDNIYYVNSKASPYFFFGGACFFLGGIEMIFEEKKIILKNGVTAILKTPEIFDAEMLLDSIKTSTGETEFLSRTIEAWESVTVENEEKFIYNVRESLNTLFIACYVDGVIAGNCDITFKTGSKTSHRATVGIALQKKYWNIGIGSAMFKELIKTAEEHIGTEIVDLEFIEGNNRAKALYEKFGFEVISVKSKYFKFKDGTYQNLVYMQKYL